MLISDNIDIIIIIFSRNKGEQFDLRLVSNHYWESKELSRLRFGLVEIEVGKWSHKNSLSLSNIWINQRVQQHCNWLQCINTDPWVLIHLYAKENSMFTIYNKYTSFISKNKECMCYKSYSTHSTRDLTDE